MKLVKYVVLHFWVFWVSVDCFEKRCCCVVCICSDFDWQNFHLFCFGTVKTQIIQPPVDTRVLLGHTATLQCKVSSDPLVPYQLDWYHEKQ